LWLEAHTQPDPAERTRRLTALAAQYDASNPYADLARAALEAERLAAPPPAPRQRWPLWALLGVGVVVVAAALLSNPRPADPTLTPTSPPATLAPTPLPDRSTPLTGDAYTVRYADGLLSVVAVEDDSGRATEGDGLQPLAPLDGARFYAVEVAFECRAAICDQPPQADLALRLFDGSRIAPRPRTALIGQDTLAPVALGRITRGWLVFEIPRVGVVQALEVLPPVGDGVEIGLEGVR
jgi:hypothetical protein